MNKKAFRSFFEERAEAVKLGLDSFVYSGNGKTYARVYDDSKIIKYKLKRSRKKSKRRSRKSP